MLETDQTSGTASPHAGLARLSCQVSRRRVLLVFRHAVDSKQHGRSVPAPRGFGRGSPGREGRPELEVTKRAATPRSSGQTVCCCTIHKRADSAPLGLWVQTPKPVHDVIGVVTGPCPETNMLEHVQHAP